MLRRQVAEIGRQAGAGSVAAAFYDYETATAWSYHGDRWFHAASTIKVAILLGLYLAIDEGRFGPGARLHVRNRFLSTVDGEPYRVAASRDADAEVHAAVGKTMRVDDLARHMIVTSSNLATNLLLDLVGAGYIRERLAALGLDGVDLQRGVEDERAFQAGLNNRVTALGLIRLFRLIHEAHGLTAASAAQMREVLFQQAFRSGIPAGLPEEVRDQARVGNKTGEISTVAHDAGLVYLPDRQPYVVAILTQWDPEQTAGRRDALAAISRAVYDYLKEPEPE